MLNRCLIPLLACVLSVNALADALIVADEFPAMEVLARRLKAEEGVTSQLVDQGHLPGTLATFNAVVVYIHKGLEASAEQKFIEYARAGGRLVLLHHSISSGKRQNHDWFSFLGVDLPQGDVEQGGYKWIEDVQVKWFNLAPNHFIMTNRIAYRQTVTTGSDNGTQTFPAFTLSNTEVYLNHVLKGPHTLLMGLQYTDPKTARTWTQQTAGWIRPVEKGWVIYFMPGHTLHDFEDPVYGRIVINALTAQASVLASTP